MLRDTQKLDAFLDAVFSQAGGPVSVKTRLGVVRAEEFGEIIRGGHIAVVADRSSAGGQVGSKGFPVGLTARLP